MTDAAALFLAYSALMAIVALSTKSHRLRLFVLAMWLCAYTFTTPFSTRVVEQEPILPDEFILVAAVVQEPSGNYPGQIWLWARTKEDPLSPKSFSLPYDKEAAQVVKGWIKKIGGGKAELGVNLNAKQESTQQEQEQEPQPLRLPNERDA